MGRPEGPGCYCYANNILKSVLKGISTHYPFVVIDNEAGLENLSRRIYQDVSTLVMVTDASHQGLATIKRLYQLANEMSINYKKLAILVNRVHASQLSEKFQKLQCEINADLLVPLPENDELRVFGEEGRDLTQLSNRNPVVQQLDQFLKNIGV